MKAFVAIPPAEVEDDAAIGLGRTRLAHAASLPAKSDGRGF
jgi:hypothetical protein